MRIALVVLDTLRKDIFDDYFQWLPGKQYERVFSPSHWTVPVHASLFTGKYPSQLGVHSRYSTLDVTENTIAERFKSAGYETRAFSANSNITPQFSFDRGFNEIELGWRAKPFQEDVFPWGSHAEEHNTLYRAATGLASCFRGDYDTVASLKYGLNLKRGHEDEGAKHALSWLERQEFGSDEFVFLNLMEAHGPYRAPNEYATTPKVSVDGLGDTISGNEYRLAEIAYRDCVRYLSDVYREIFGIFQSEVFDLIITCSDHGELFGEHGVWQHDYGVYPELTHVPLSIEGKRLSDRSSSNRLVSLLDVHTTLLEVSGLDDSTSGINLIDEPAGREHVFTEYHGVPLQEKYDNLIDRFGLETVRAYDNPLFGVATPEKYAWEDEEGLNGDAIPDEARELLDSHAERARNLIAGTEGKTVVPKPLKRHLRHLGYL